MLKVISTFPFLCLWQFVCQYHKHGCDFLRQHNIADANTCVNKSLRLCPAKWNGMCVCYCHLLVKRLRHVAHYLHMNSNRQTAAWQTDCQLQRDGQWVQPKQTRGLPHSKFKSTKTIGRGGGRWRQDCDSCWLFSHSSRVWPKLEMTPFDMNDRCLSLDVHTTRPRTQNNITWPLHPLVSFHFRESVNPSVFTKYPFDSDYFSWRNISHCTWNW